jgi:pyruvate formate lyase activating enzyme
MHFTAFHPDWKMMDVPATPAATLTRARNIAIANGVRYAYTGNVVDEAGESTYCHQCKIRIIGRNRYNLTAWNMDDDGCCKNCGTPCVGRFEPQPGTWGSRFQPVHMDAYAA